jgi:hypothetical protein
VNRKIFFDIVRKNLHPKGFEHSQVNGLTVMLDAFEKYRWPINYAAYALATTWREVGGTYQPVREGFKKTDAEARAYAAKHYPKKYGKPTIYAGQYAYGRGLVQLTWADPTHIDNYAKADTKLSAKGLIGRGDLIDNFDLALRPDLAVVIMMDGMDEGWFTGKKNSDYLVGPNPDFRNARRIINGLDHADEIAATAKKFLYALQQSGYGLSASPAPKPTPAPEPELVIPKLPEVPNRVSWLEMTFAGLSAWFRR